jgi:formylglycine-generating enzyme required for sulfatase activity
VVLVTWHEAMAYCQWLGNQRLPTQEEWQEACRAPDFVKWGNVWEWTTTDAESPPGWKMLCGPRHTCACTHQYNPADKNFVKGFRCTRALPLALYSR